MDPRLVLAWQAALSLVTLLMAAVDKSRARSRRRRVPESTLLLLAAMGGAPGLALAIVMFRHKTRKPAFALPALALAAAHVALAVWLVA